QLDALVAVPAGRRVNLGERLARRRLGRQADHAAGRVAVQGRARPPNDLDLLRGAEVDAVDRALPVGQGLRNAVDEDLDAAYAEVRARAEAANRHAQILREVEAVLHEEARHAGQRLIEAELLPGDLDLVLGDDADGGRDLVERRLETRRPDDNLLERRQCR